jgi:hypothetical protein
MVLNLLIQLALEVTLSYWSSRLTAPDGPRLTDLNGLQGDYGVPMNRLFGGATRVGAVVIAATPLIEVANEQDNDTVDFLLGGLLGLLVPAPKTYTYHVTLACLIADRTFDGPIEDVDEIWANGKKIYDGSPGPTKLWKSITIHNGDFTQTADPVLTAKGLIDGEAFRGSAYVVIEDLQLTQEFGNSIPQLEFLVRAKTDQSLADVANVVCRAAGIDAEHNLSTSELSSIPIKGFAILQATNCWDALKPLMPAYGVDVGEVAGQIRFYRRGHNMRSIIPISDMGAHSPTEARPEPYSLSHGPDVGLPQQVAVTFRDPERDYQPNTQMARRTLGDAQSNVANEYLLTLSADEGRAMAQALLWEPWTGKTSNAFALSDKWLSIEPGVVYGVETPVGIRAQRVVRRTRGANGVIAVELVSDESAVYSSRGPGGSGSVPTNTPPATPTAVPSTPLGLVATPGNGSASLDWSANPVREDVTHYNIYRADGTGALFGAASLIDTATGTSWGEVGLAVSAGYTYFIEAENIVGPSLPTAGVNLTTTALPQNPGQTVTYVATETLADGDLVSFWIDSGVTKVRLADATDDSRQPDGFVLVGAAIGALVKVSLAGSVDTARSGLSPGEIYFLDTTPGQITLARPSAAGTWGQEVGKALDATSLLFDPKAGTLNA